MGTNDPRSMTRFPKGEYSHYRDYLAHLTKHGEYGAEGRPRVEVDGIDKLLFMLRIVHGKPRYDLWNVAPARAHP